MILISKTMEFFFPIFLSKWLIRRFQEHNWLLQTNPKIWWCHSYCFNKHTEKGFNCPVKPWLNMSDKRHLGGFIVMLTIDFWNFWNKWPQVHLLCRVRMYGLIFFPPCQWTKLLWELAYMLQTVIHRRQTPTPLPPSPRGLSATFQSSDPSSSTHANYTEICCFPLFIPHYKTEIWHFQLQFRTSPRWEE